MKIDVDLLMTLSRDVVINEEIRPFPLSSNIKLSEDQPIKGKDSGVQLLLAPLLKHANLVFTIIQSSCPV